MLNIRLFGYHFSPAWIPSIATALLLPLLISLGCWQLQRAEYKHMLQNKYQNRLTTPLSQVIEMNSAQKDWAALDYYPIKVTGHYDNQHNILLDNKIQNHQVGYHVITPFITHDDNKNNYIILINRGWIPREKTPSQLPTLTPVLGTQTITGLIHIPSKHSFSLGQNYPTEINWPLVMQTINLTDITKLLQQPIQPFTILLNSNNPYGFARDWQPIIHVPPEKHLGYAFQWFALAFALLVIYIVVNTKKEKNHEA